jgi:hypothetical protein
MPRCDAFLCWLEARLHSDDWFTAAVLCVFFIAPGLLVAAVSAVLALLVDVSWAGGILAGMLFAFAFTPTAYVYWRDYRRNKS